MELHAIADLPMRENDADASTVGEYLKSLLARLWQEEECFSGKRPFGNSGWQYDVYAALVSGAAIGGSLDEDGHPEEFNSAEADELIECLVGQISFAEPTP